tara:strand:+ start:71561 stop:72139 length:579 start_codon:yes stop_codon:yes gene_type:complete
MIEEIRNAGRPRNPETADKIKSVTLRLMRAQGYEAVSIASIISEAGIAKQTIYNRWSTKADLVLDAIFEETARYASSPHNENDNTSSEQLYDFLLAVFEHLKQDSPIICALIASAQDDEAFQQSFINRFVKPRELLVEKILRRAQSRGEISDGRDVQTLLFLIHGAFWYPLLNGMKPDQILARNIVDEIFRK